MPFCAPGLFSTLCTAFYALFGMLLRGGKTVEKHEFLQTYFLLFIYCYFVCFRMFVTFTYLFLCRCRSEIVCVGTSPWIHFALVSAVRDFHECFGKLLYGRNLLLTIQKNLFLLLPRDIRFSTNEGVISASVWRICRRFLKFAYVAVCVCMGKVHSLRVRGISRRHKFLFV